MAFIIVYVYALYTNRFLITTANCCRTLQDTQ